ncbi:rhodanese-related sulfurtransferase [Niveispirillum fermenti]|uniref:oxygen-dependent tRNA uridine(34) hydroxylase TrhO n=1 Tax=Niveispirillum fermenti TaxID=1233113 RepID=UPI003A872796
MTDIAVAALYRFHPLPHFRDLRQPLYDMMAAAGVRGSLLLAAEGLNGTIAGPAALMEGVVGRIAAIAGIAPLEPRWSQAGSLPFGRLKVRLKKEIVTMGVPAADPLRAVGTYVEPEDWNALISDPDTLVIDTRNSFEVAHGTFRGAVDPGTASFGQFPDYVRRNLDPARQRRVAMFCTGGIRCEKATAYMLQQGFGEVYHLKGGILNYLERIEPQDSLWQGGCFVFDDRVALGHGLVPVHSGEGDAAAGEREA